MAEAYEVLSDMNSHIYGEPAYDGMEWDYEVPDQMLVESPGGVSSTHHHWTKGFYGDGGGVSSDIFGNDAPAHVYGDVGSMYQTGPTATQTLGPPGGLSYPSPPRGTSPKYIQNQAPPAPPGEPEDNIEFIGASKKRRTREKFDGDDDDDTDDEGDADTDTDDESGVKTKVGPEAESLRVWKTFAVYLIAFVTFSFWAWTANAYLQQTRYKGRKVPWLTMLMAALGLTVLLMGATWVTKFTGRFSS